MPQHTLAHTVVGVLSLMTHVVPSSSWSFFAAWRRFGRPLNRHTTRDRRLAALSSSRFRRQKAQFWSFPEESATMLKRVSQLRFELDSSSIRFDSIRYVHSSSIRAFGDRCRNEGVSLNMIGSLTGVMTCPEMTCSLFI